MKKSMRIHGRTGTTRHRVVRRPRSLDLPSSGSHTSTTHESIAALALALASDYGADPARTIPVLNAIFSRCDNFFGSDPHRHPEVDGFTFGEVRQYIVHGKNGKFKNPRLAALSFYSPQPTQRQLMGKT